MDVPTTVPAGQSQQIGKPFNPSRGSCGFHVPDVLSRRRELGDGPKRLLRACGSLDG
jgi:hypothetical protein